MVRERVKKNLSVLELCDPVRGEVEPLCRSHCFLRPLLQLSSPPPAQELDFYDSSPMFLRRSSLTSSLNDDDDDDGFLDVLDDNMEVSH